MGKGGNKISGDVAQKRLELIKAAEEKKIKRTAKFLTKCEDEDILRIHKEFTDKENKKVIDALCPGILSKGAHLLEYLECVPDRYALSNDLAKDELFRKDVWTLCSHLAPYIPCPGLVTGGFTIGQHIYNKKVSDPEQEEPRQGPQERDPRRAEQPYKE